MGAAERDAIAIANQLATVTVGVNIFDDGKKSLLQQHQQQSSTVKLGSSPSMPRLAGMNKSPSFIIKPGSAVKQLT